MAGRLAESTCLGVFVLLHNVTHCCCCAAAAVVYEYVSTERCAPSALLLVSRPKPAPADFCCGLATERCAARGPSVGREATTLYSCVTIQLIDISAAVCCGGEHLEFRELAIFRYEELITHVVGFWV